MYIIVNESFSKIETKVTEAELNAIASRQGLQLEFKPLGVYCDGVLVAVK